jgi:hypothetical protein
MRFAFRTGTVIVLLVLGSCPLSARASQVIVGNLSATPDPVASPSVIDPGDFWAQEFTSGVPATLQSIEASLGNFSAGNNGDFVLTAQLFQVSTLMSTPDQGTQIATLTQNGAIPTTGNGYANVEFDASPSVALSPNLFYWLVFTASSSDNTGQVDWQFTDSTSVIGPGSLSNAAVMSPGIPPPWTVFQGAPFLMQVNGTIAVVPEPSSLMLGCAGFSAVLLAAFRSRARGASRLASK